MGRRLTVLATSAALLATTWVAAPAQAAPAASEFQVAIVVGEGPDRPSGSTFSFQAGLVSDGAPVAEAPVTLLGRPYGATTFAPLASTTTGADGTAQVAVTLQRTTQVKWAFAGDAEHAATESFPYTEPVGTRVTARAVDPTLRGRQKVVVLGRTDPAKAGLRVSLWRGDKPAFMPDLEMTRIGVATVRKNGTFHLGARFHHPGAKKLYVKVVPGRGTTAGYSRYLHVRVR